MSTITRQRLRETILANSPKLKQKLQKCDDALASPATLGNALATLLPADEPVVIQEALFEIPQKGGY